MDSKRGLPLDWISNLKGKDKENFETVVRHSTQLLTRLREIISERLDHISKEEVREASYDNPSWAYKQAYFNGKRAALLDLKQLTDFLGDK